MFRCAARCQRSLRSLASIGLITARDSRPTCLTAVSFAGELVARLPFHNSGFRSLQRMSFRPKRPGRRQRIYSGTLPPGCLIPAAMDLSVMRTAERHGKLIADLAPESPRFPPDRNQLG
jgi:hypothetical protein